MPSPVPLIETLGGTTRRTPTAPRRAVAFLSGGVDGLHMLMRNRLLYNRDDAAYVHEALFIHGFDIGKRARDPENGRYGMMLRRLQPVVADLGLRLIRCRTNLRHLPSKPGFWEHRHNGADWPQSVIRQSSDQLFYSSERHGQRPIRFRGDRILQ